MKKKLLSLVLAGAMVASTSVSAFAATEPTPTTTTTTTMSVGEDEKDIDVGITGDILDNNGNVKPGTISVTVPTAVNFTVTKDGRLASGDMVITNNSNEKIKVSVKKFTDADATNNINIVKKSVFDNASGVSDIPREKIWLNLIGNGVSVGFESEGRGKMYNPANDNEINSSEEIGKINGSGELRLRLEGGGGTQPGSSSDPIKDNFNLVLTIARDRA